MYIRSIKSHKGSNEKRKFSLDGLILRMKDQEKTKERTLAQITRLDTQHFLKVLCGMYPTSSYVLQSF